jgi:3-oxoacyl-(acyl-carrier-protein) synthase
MGGYPSRTGRWNRADERPTIHGGFDPDLVVAPKDQRRMDRFILFALAATAEAIAQAAWILPTHTRWSARRP